jgi:hypothetical protein
MTKNPFLNALSASVYIVVVVSVMTFLSQTQKNKPDTFLAPILALSLLTLSVAVMAYVFFYQPLQLFLDGKKKQAINLFLQTVAVFAGITVIVFVLLFLGVFK